MDDYEMVYRVSARAAIQEAGWDAQDADRMIRADLAQCGAEHPMRVFFHTVPITERGYDGPCVICEPRDGVMVVSLAEWETVDTETELVDGIKMVKIPESVTDTEH